MGSDVRLFCTDRLRENLHYYHLRAAPLAATPLTSLWRAGVETVRLTQLDPFLLDSPVSLLCRLAGHTVQCKLLSYNKRLLDRWEVRDLAGLQRLQRRLLSLGLTECPGLEKRDSERLQARHRNHRNHTERWRAVADFTVCCQYILM